jgi:seryl-tRNA synthetase
MLELKFVRDQRDRIVEGLKKRNYPADTLGIVDEIIAMDDQRKMLKTKLDQCLADRNRLSKEIGALFQSGKKDEAAKIKDRVSELKESAERYNTDMQEVEALLKEALLSVPNVPHTLVPLGSTEADNETVKDWEGLFPDLGADALPHWDLAEKYNLIDFKLGVLITGSGFPLFRGKGAKLQRALINLFLDEGYKAGYEEIVPPLLVNADTAMATGQLPDKEGQMYVVERDGLYLIPTAEVPLTNMYRGAILRESDFPIKLTGYTPCFRREAGSYGSDVKGLNRVHQFDKVEIVQMQHPDHSYDTLREMLDHVSGILDKLELPYRIVRLCGGDLGFTSALTYDFEVYAAGQGKWLEVSSVSNFEKYQANRMKLRYKDSDGKIHLAHTLNGSALALARIIAALLENNQTDEGIVIPKVLRPYTGFDLISETMS